MEQKCCQLLSELEKYIEGQSFWMAEAMQYIVWRKKKSLFAHPVAAMGTHFQGS